MAESAFTTLPVTSQVAQGLAEAEFDPLMRLHQRRVYRLLLGMLRDPEAADTLTQECFLRAWRKRSSFRGEASVATWLLRIAVNLARDHARNRRLAFWRRLFASPAEDARAQAEQLPSLHAGPEQVLLARQELDAVWSVVEALRGSRPWHSRSRPPPRCGRGPIACTSSAIFCCARAPPRVP